MLRSASSACLLGVSHGDSAVCMSQHAVFLGLWEQTFKTRSSAFGEHHLPLLRVQNSTRTMCRVMTDVHHDSTAVCVQCIGAVSVMIVLG